MLAKSAPQLLASPLHRARRAVLHVRGTLAILVLALLMSGAAWLLDRGRNESGTADAVVQPESAPASEISAVGAASEPVFSEAKAKPENKRYRALSEFLAKRYKVSEDVTMDLVSIAYAAGHQVGIDPVLILAVISVESRFNPIAESVAGAKGLMQIIPKYHSEKFREFGGVKAVFDPETNILVGSKIIKEYLRRTGRLDSALQLYGGALSDENAVYFEKVMTEKERLQQVLRNSAPAGSTT
ncbi:MAG TPA: lytic transglycosylase domain-containing protein [Burkholderiales bacterium]|nr:lytic transglycosylase domain-containing protein [Burkholderiales bacterium]